MWGRTSICCIRAPNTSSSNSRPRVGANNWGDSCRNITIAPTRAPGGTNEKEAIRISQRSELQLPPLAGGELFICTYASKRQKATTHTPVRGKLTTHRILRITSGLQLTPPRVGRTTENAWFSFNSRPVWGSERVCTDKTLLAVALQPTPHGGRTQEDALRLLDFLATTHALCGGRTAVVPISLFAEKLQPTSPCVGERPWLDVGGAVTDTSTHAPAWGRMGLGAQN